MITELKIEDVSVKERFRKDFGDIELLANSINSIGLLHPVVVNSNNELICGGRRLKAFQFLGKVTIPARVIDIDSIILGEYAENEVRKDFTVSERVAIGEAVEVELGERRGGDQKSKCKILHNDPNEGSKTIEIAAQKSGFRNKETYRQAKKVVETATPELVEAMDSGRVKPSVAEKLTNLPPADQILLASKGKEKEAQQAAKEIRANKAEKRHEERIQRIVEISQGNKELNTSKTYPVIYADPPWRYDHAVSDTRQIENHYPTMELNDICALPVSEISTKDSILFMWTTSPKLLESFDVISSWGFSYRTCAIWDKKKIGMGYYFRQQHEILLVATKGEIPAPPVSSRISSVISIDRSNHSAKPDEFYEIIENMYPDLPKIELFSRNKRDGWESWGNQS